MKPVVFLILILTSAAVVWSRPVIDGSVKPGEYAESLKVLDGAVTISYQADEQGGLYLAVSAPTHGWVGLGLGSAVMNGATIFMGYVKDGQAVFSEQKGAGHTHKPSTTKIADQSTVGQSGDFTTIEFHIAADKLPFSGKQFNYIVAYANAADLTTFHEDDETGGVITLP
jgi:hypothetical protein